MEPTLKSCSTFSMAISKGVRDWFRAEKICSLVWPLNVSIRLRVSSIKVIIAHLIESDRVWYNYFSQEVK